MRRFFLVTSAVVALGLSEPASAQGVPTFDGSQLGQLVAQLEHMAEGDRQVAGYFPSGYAFV